MEEKNYFDFRRHKRSPTQHNNGAFYFSIEQVIHFNTAKSKHTHSCIPVLQNVRSALMAMKDSLAVVAGDPGKESAGNQTMTSSSIRGVKA